MFKNTHHRFRPILQLATALLLAAALLSGCAAPTASEEPSTDEDFASEAISGSVSMKDGPSRARISPQPISDQLKDDSPFSVLFVNVGKADACVIRIGSYVALIDAGSADSIPQLFAGLNALNIDHIDAVFITHSHSDHIGGLDALAANYEISIVYSPFFSEANKDGEGKIVKRVEKLGLRHRELRAGDAVAIEDGVSFGVLGPLSLNEENDNDNSLVLRFEYKWTTILFTGDMQYAEEQTVMDSGADLRSDILKVGNHGNPDATGDAFAAQVAPGIAVISTDTTVDEDSANPRVLAALPNSNAFVTEDFPIGLLVTADNGNLTFFSNPAKEPPILAIRVGANAKRQTVTLTNDSASGADLSGCLLFSAETGAALHIPAGTLLPAGGSLTIGEGESLSFPGDDNPLRKKKNNAVELYDAFGNLIGNWTDE